MAIMIFTEVAFNLGNNGTLLSLHASSFPFLLFFADSFATIVWGLSGITANSPPSTAASAEIREKDLVKAEEGRNDNRRSQFGGVFAPIPRSHQRPGSSGASILWAHVWAHATCWLSSGIPYAQRILCS